MKTYSTIPAHASKQAPARARTRPLAMALLSLSTISIVACGAPPSPEETHEQVGRATEALTMPGPIIVNLHCGAPGESCCPGQTCNAGANCDFETDNPSVYACFACGGPTQFHCFNGAPCQPGLNESYGFCTDTCGGDGQYCCNGPTACNGGLTCDPSSDHCSTCVLGSSCDWGCAACNDGTCQCSGTVTSCANPSEPVCAGACNAHGGARSGVGCVQE
jgi:hypothetical protein